MGCDYFADEDGGFRMLVTDGRGRKLGEIELDDLEPGQKLYRDLIVGRDR